MFGELRKEYKMVEVLPTICKEILKKGVNGMILEKTYIFVSAETSDKAFKLFNKIVEDGKK